MASQWCRFSKLALVSLLLNFDQCAGLSSLSRPSAGLQAGDNSGKAFALAQDGQAPAPAPPAPGPALYEAEWNTLSKNDTVPVYMMASGSLVSMAFRQRTASATKPKEMSPLHPMKVPGIVREFASCQRYVGLSVRACQEEDEKCPDIQSFFFEFVGKKDEYVKFREKEAEKNHTVLTLTLDKSELEQVSLPATASYVAMGRNDKNIHVECPKQIGTNRDPFVSLAYWDMILGAILSWDGQLKTKRYTWLLELEVKESAKLKNDARHFPSLSFGDRWQLAVEFVRTTSWTNFSLLDDRRCPFTHETIITPSYDLDSNVKNPKNLAVVGSCAPTASPGFHAIVNHLLSEGQWQHGGMGEAVYLGAHGALIDCSEAPSLENRPVSLYYGDVFKFMTDTNRLKKAMKGNDDQEDISLDLKNITDFLIQVENYADESATTTTDDNTSIDDGKSNVSL